MNRLAIAAVVAFSLVIGFAVGQGVNLNTARAQEPSAEKMATTVKAELVDVFTRFHESIPADVLESLRQVGLASRAGGNLAVETYVPRYFRGLAILSQDHPLVAHYVRYLAPALSAGVVRAPEDLLKDRFLDHFSQVVATTGAPPVFPPLTPEEITHVEDRLYYQRPAWRTNWPFEWTASWLLGVS